MFASRCIMYLQAKKPIKTEIKIYTKRFRLQVIFSVKGH